MQAGLTEEEIQASQLAELLAMGWTTEEYAEACDILGMDATDEVLLGMDWPNDTKDYEVETEAEDVSDDTKSIGPSGNSDRRARAKSRGAPPPNEPW
jgi:hypothetical protein